MSFDKAARISLIVFFTLSFGITKSFAQYVNPIVFWNQVAAKAIASDTRAEYKGPTWPSRNYAILHLAVFDALNSID